MTSSAMLNIKLYRSSYIHPHLIFCHNSKFLNMVINLNVVKNIQVVARCSAGKLDFFRFGGKVGKVVGGKKVGGKGKAEKSKDFFRLFGGKVGRNTVTLVLF